MGSKKVNINILERPLRPQISSNVYGCIAIFCLRDFNINSLLHCLIVQTDSDTMFSWKNTFPAISFLHSIFQCHPALSAHSTVAQQTLKQKYCTLEPCHQEGTKVTVRRVEVTITWKLILWERIRELCSLSALTEKNNRLLHVHMAFWHWMERQLYGTMLAWISFLDTFGIH